uniref:Uncharacterized protein n=1 Tax=uncultured marine virus TaxID=186617 RepID=A0A0F7L585_9VIRU|nr:hypothetical protein [uncultured marine virus]
MVHSRVRLGVYVPRTVTRGLPLPTGSPAMMPRYSTLIACPPRTGPRAPAPVAGTGPASALAGCGPRPRP